MIHTYKTQINLRWISVLYVTAYICACTQTIMCLIRMYHACLFHAGILHTHTHTYTHTHTHTNPTNKQAGMIGFTTLQQSAPSQMTLQDSNASRKHW